MGSQQEVAGAKAELRRRLLSARRARPAAELELARAALAEVVLGRAAARRWRRVAAYEPLRTEPGSVALLAGLVELGVTVTVPVTLPDNDLDWVRWGSTEPLGTGSIAEQDAVLVPALAVGPDGARLGRGGGSYDRALARVPGGVPLVALLFRDELLDSVPTAAWDVPVTAAARPSGWTELAGGNPEVAPGT